MCLSLQSILLWRGMAIKSKKTAIMAVFALDIDRSDVVAIIII